MFRIFRAVNNAPWLTVITQIFLAMVYSFSGHLIFGIAACFLIYSCSDDPVIDPMEPIVEPMGKIYDVTNFPSDLWLSASPEQVGMDADKLQEGLNYAFTPSLNTQGVVVIRHGVIVAERYADGRNEETLATSWSTAKSFSSALIGIAMDRGYIESVDDPVSKYLEEWKETDKEDITLRAILEMRSGLVVSNNEVVELYILGGNQGNQLTPSIFRDVEKAPHTEWSYQNANSMLLGEIVSRTSGMNTQEFAEEFLFSKIGMDATWWQDAAGHTLTYCCIDATSRDFARFGMLYARNGNWNTDEVVSSEWVKESTKALEGADFYGLHWVVNEQRNMFASAGLHQNNIYVFPELDLVIVRNSIFNQQGTEAIRSGLNFHETLEPANWMDEKLIDQIMNAVID